VLLRGAPSHINAMTGFLREALVREAIASQLAEPLEMRGVANEILEGWTRREESLFKLRSKPSAHGDVLMHPCVHAMRQWMLKLSLYLTQSQEYPEICFFQAVQLFDASIPDIMMKAEFSQHLLAAHTAAAWMICAKLVGIGDQWRMMRLPSDIASHVTEFSRHFGGTQVAAEDIVKVEVELLSLFRFNVHTTTVDTWADAFLVRLDAATGCKVIGPGMATCRQLCSCWASLMAWHMPVSGAHPPSMLALGIVGLALISLKVLSLEALNQDLMVAEQWADCIDQILHMTQARVQNNLFGESSAMLPSKAVVPAVEFATMHDVASVWESVVVVIRILHATFLPQMPDNVQRGSKAAVQSAI